MTAKVKSKIKTRDNAHRRPHARARRDSQRLHFNLLDWAVLATAFITVVIAATNYHGDPLYLTADAITLIAGAFYMILSAKGRRSNFIFSIFSVIAFIYIAWANQFYGSMAINALYYLPCTFIGFYLWGHYSGKNHEVKARRLSPRQLIFTIISIAITSLILKIILDAFSGANTTMDSVATIISLVANLLVLLRYREQWLLWLVTDVIQLIMWIGTDDPIMIVLRILYPVTAIYGYINWRRLVQTPARKQKR